MPKYSIGIQYTVWVDCEADTEEQAVLDAVNTPYNFVDVHQLPNVKMELQEFEDPIVYVEETV